MKKRLSLGVLFVTLSGWSATAGTLELIGMEVDSFSGSGLYRANDLRILPWSGVPIELSRTYRTARHDVSGALGPGWSHSFSSRLEATTNGVRLVSDDGVPFYFTTSGSGAATRYMADLEKGAGSMLSLTNNAVGDVVATAGDDRRYVYYPLSYASPVLRGKLREVVMPYSTSAVVRCQYDGSGRLVSILDRISGLGFVLSYGAGAQSALVTSMEENFQLPGEATARRCEFSYEDGQLVRATSRGGLPDDVYEYDRSRLSRISCGQTRDTSIRYNSQGGIAALVDAWNSPRDASGQPVPITFSYDADERVRIRWDDGTDVSIETRLADAPGAFERIRTVVDPVARTTRTEAWTFDRLTGDLLKQVEADGRESLYEYTESSISLRQRRPGMVAHVVWEKTYDARGRLKTTEFSGAGEQPASVVSNEYEETAASGETPTWRMRSQFFGRMGVQIADHDRNGRPRRMIREVLGAGGSKWRDQLLIQYADPVTEDGSSGIDLFRFTGGSSLAVSNVLDAAGRLVETVKTAGGHPENEVRYAFHYDRADRPVRITRSRPISIPTYTEGGTETEVYTNSVNIYEASYDENGRRIQETVLGETFTYAYEGLRRTAVSGAVALLDYEGMAAEMNLVSRRNAIWMVDVVEHVATGSSPDTPLGWPFWISLAGTGW